MSTARQQEAQRVFNAAQEDRELYRERSRIFQAIRRRYSGQATPAEVERLAQIKAALGGDYR